MITDSKKDISTKTPCKPVNVTDTDPMKCECLYWAGIWDKEELKGEKNHHPRCKYRKEEP